MEKLVLSDIKNIADYEKERPEFYQHVVELKKRRRVFVGDKVINETLHPENPI